MNMNDKQDTVENRGVGSGTVAPAATQRPPRRRRRFLRILLCSLASAIVLLIVAVLYLKSEHCFRHFIVPKLQKWTGRDIAFDRLKIRLFRGAEIKGLTLGPLAGEPRPLLKSDKIAVEWNTRALLRRRVDLRSVKADGLLISIVEQPKRSGQAPPKSPKPTSEKKEGTRKGEPVETRVLIEDLHLTSASVEWIRMSPDRQSIASRYAVRDLEIEGSQLGIGRPASLDLRARIAADDASQGVHLSDGRIALKVNSQVGAEGGAYTLGGEWSVERLRGEFHGVAAQDLRATGSLEIEQSDPRRMVIRRADAAMSYQRRRGVDLSLSGEVNPATGDGNLRLGIAGINRDFLNLLSTPEQPLDFRGTMVGGRITVETSDRRNRIAVESDLRLTDFSVVAPALAPAPTPLTQMSVQCKAVYSALQKNIGLERLDLRASQDGRNVVAANLTNPIKFSLVGSGAIATSSAAELAAKVDGLALSQFNPFLSRKKVRIESGKLTIDSALSVAAAGQSVAARGRVDFADLRASIADSKMEKTDIGAVYDLAFSKGGFSIKTLNCDVRLAGQPAGQIKGSGEIAPGGQKGEIVLSGDRLDLSALQVFLAEVPNVRIRAGRVNFSQKIAFAGPETPIRFEGRFDGADLSFDIPRNPRARFTGWTIRGGNLVRFDSTKQTADVTTLSLLADEKGSGGLRAGAKGRLDFKQGSGLLSLDVRDAGVLFLASVLDRLGAEASGDVRPAGGAISGTVELKLDRQFADLSMKGGLRSRGMRWTVGDGKTAQSGARDLEASYDVVLLKSKGRSELAIQDALVRVIGTGAEAGSLRTNGRLDLAQNTGNLTVRFTRFDSAPVLSLVGPLLGPWRPTNGVLDGQQEIKFGGTSGDITAIGKLRADQLRLAVPKGKGPIAPPTLEVENTVALLQGGKAIRANPLIIRTFQGATQSGSLSVSGQADFAQSKGTSSLSKGTLAVSAENFEVAPIWSILAAMGTDLPLTGGRLNGKQDLRFALANDTIEAKGNLRADGVQIRPTAGSAPIAPLSLAINNDLSLSADKTSVRSLQLSTFSAGQPLDQITVSAQGGGLRSKQKILVAVRAPTLHLDPYMAIVSAVSSKADKGGTPKPAAAASSAQAAAKSGSGGGASASSVPPIQASIGIGKLYCDRLYVENILGTADVTAQGVTVKPLTARLVDGAATATAWIRTDTANMPYAGRIRGEKLNVASLLALVSPGSERKLAGTGKTTFEFSGRGFDGASLRRDLHSSGTLQIVNGEMKEIPILSELAGITRVDSLADIRFFQLDGQWKLDNGVIDIPNAFLVGNLQKLRAKGQIGFDEKINLTFDLWLGGELKNRLGGNKILRYLKEESDRFLRLPIPIGMGGTLSKPRPTLNLPLESVLDIGIEQGLKALKKYEDMREEKREKRKK
jgi:hypothetical protein